MSRSSELPDLVQAEYTVETIKRKELVTSIDGFDTPKEIVFREDADLLTTQQQNVFMLVIEGKNKYETALKLDIEFNTVTSHLSNIADRIEGRFIFFEVEPPLISNNLRSRVWMLISLLMLGELELCDTDNLTAY